MIIYHPYRDYEPLDLLEIRITESMREKKRLFRKMTEYWRRKNLVSLGKKKNLSVCRFYDFLSWSLKNQIELLLSSQNVSNIYLRAYQNSFRILDRIADHPRSHYFDLILLSLGDFIKLWESLNNFSSKIQRNFRSHLMRKKVSALTVLNQRSLSFDLIGKIMNFTLEK